MNWTKNFHGYVHKIVDVHGLSCVEINRLMHENNVLTRFHNYIKNNCVCRSLEIEL